MLVPLRFWVGPAGFERNKLAKHLLCDSGSNCSSSDVGANRVDFRMIAWNSDGSAVMLDQMGFVGLFFSLASAKIDLHGFRKSSMTGCNAHIHTSQPDVLIALWLIGPFGMCVPNSTRFRIDVRASECMTLMMYNGCPLETRNDVVPLHTIM